MTKVTKYLERRKIKLLQERDLLKTRIGNIQVEVKKIESMIRGLKRIK